MPNIIITVDVTGTLSEELKAKLLAIALEYDSDAIVEIEGPEGEDENEEETE